MAEERRADGFRGLSLGRLNSGPEVKPLWLQLTLFIRSA